MYKAAAVIWCAFRVRMTCVAWCKESAFPTVAMFACTSACTHPLVANRQWSSEQPFQCGAHQTSPQMYLLHTSQATSTGSVWLKHTVVGQTSELEFALLTTSIDSLIIATGWALSWKRGSKAVGVMIIRSPGS